MVWWCGGERRATRVVEEIKTHHGTGFTSKPSMWGSKRNTMRVGCLAGLWGKQAHNNNASKDSAARKLANTLKKRDKKKSGREAPQRARPRTKQKTKTRYRDMDCPEEEQNSQCTRTHDHPGHQRRWLPQRSGRCRPLLETQTSHQCAVPETPFLRMNWLQAANNQACETSAQTTAWAAMTHQ